MSDDLDALDEIADQNGGVGKRGWWSVSPTLQRAASRTNRKEATADALPNAPSPPKETQPARQPVRLVPTIVRSKAELVGFLRARKEQLNLSHETIDRLVGWADRFSTKALAPVPRKGMTGDTLQAVLDALGLGVAAVVLVEDPTQTEKMRPRWTKRGNSGPRPDAVGALFCSQDQETIPSTSTTIEDEHVETPPEFPSKT